MKTIKTFMDFTCPFCYIGFSILDKLKDEEPDVEYIWYPYELDVNTPLEGKDISKRFPDGGLDEAFERIINLGNEYSLKFENYNMAYNTARAHRAALFARDSDKFYEFSEKLFKAVFQEGRNIADKEVINDIGLEVGINIAEMNRCIDDGGYEEEIREAKRLASVFQVESVPTFIVDDKKSVSKLKNYSDFKKDLKDK